MKTKRLVTLAVTLLITLAAMAQQAVTMTKYEQEYGPAATATLSNNTQQKIHKVDFRIVYYDMKGKQLDYKDFTEEVEIDPGMSKAVEIEKFKNLDNYVYCDQYRYRHQTPFKVGFQLKSVDGVASKDQTVQQLKPASENDETEDNESESSEAPLFAGLTVGMGILIGIIILALSSGWLVAVYLMARLYHQNPWIWVLVSFVLSPIIAFLLILIFGNKTPRYEQAEDNVEDRWQQ